MSGWSLGVTTLSALCQCVLGVVGPTVLAIPGHWTLGGRRGSLGAFAALVCLQLFLEVLVLLLEFCKFGGIGSSGPWLRAVLAPLVVAKIGPATGAFPQR